MFTLDEVPAADRAAVLEDAFRSYALPLRLRLSRAERLRAEFDRVVGDFGVVESFRVDGATGHVVRDVSTRDSAIPELVTVHLERSGHVQLEQDGRRAAPRPGDLVISTTASPFTTYQDRVGAQRTITIAAADVGVGWEQLRGVTARVLSARDPRIRIASHYLEETARTALEHPDAVAALGRATLEIVKVVLGVVLDDENGLRSAAALTLGERVVCFIDLNLGDPGLDAATVARAHDISVRYLYVVLAQQGIGLGDYIRANRIRRAQRMLADPALAGLAISTIAQRCGFTDHSAFSRTFRGVTGTSPREWREERVHESARPVHAQHTTPRDTTT